MGRVISKRPLIDFWEKYPESKGAMQAWYRIAGNCSAENFSELRKTFNAVDVAGKYTIFDIGGNKYRVVTVIHYDKQKIFIRGVFTHREYDKWTKDNRGK